MCYTVKIIYLLFYKNQYENLHKLVTIVDLAQKLARAVSRRARRESMDLSPS